MPMDKRHFAWDYEESKTLYYQIYPISEIGEAFEESSFCYEFPRSPLNDKLIQEMTDALSQLAEIHSKLQKC